MDKELIANNIEDMGIAEPLCKGLDILDRRERVQEGKRIYNGWLEFGKKEFGLGAVKIGENHLKNLFVGLESEGTKQEE